MAGGEGARGRERQVDFNRHTCTYRTYAGLRYTRRSRAHVHMNVSACRCQNTAVKYNFVTLNDNAFVVTPVKNQEGTKDEGGACVSRNTRNTNARTLNTPIGILQTPDWFGGM